jgi:hypothetical protein
VALRVSAWLTLQPDGLIRVQVHKAEMGQGEGAADADCRRTGLPMSRVIAEAPAA